MKELLLGTGTYRTGNFRLRSGYLGEPRLQSIRRKVTEKWGPSGTVFRQEYSGASNFEIGNQTPGVDAPETNNMALVRVEVGDL